MDRSDVHTHAGVVCLSVDTRGMKDKFLTSATKGSSGADTTGGRCMCPSLKSLSKYEHLHHICVSLKSPTRGNESSFSLSLDFLYVTALSFIGPAGQLDSSVNCTKGTKWNWGWEVMSNSSYSVTYRAAAVWGSLLETMDGFERSGALWSPPLIEFPGTGLQCWWWLWRGSCGFSGREWGPSSALTFHKHRWGGVEGPVEEGEEEEGSGRRGPLWRSVNAEVAFKNTRPRCLRAPDGDFLTAALLKADYMFW